MSSITGRPPEKRAQHLSTGATNNTSFGVGSSGSSRVTRELIEIIGCSAPKPGCGSSQARKVL